MPIAEWMKMFTLLLVEENWLSCRNSTYSMPIADHRSFSGKNSAHILEEFSVLLLTFLKISVFICFFLQKS